MNSHRQELAKRGRLRQSGVSLATILGIIAVIAIIVLVVLLVRQTQQAGTAGQQAEEQITQLQRELRGAEARARLNGLKSAIASGVEEEALRDQYESIRADLEETYADAEGQAAETWDSISDRLDQLGDQLGAESQEAIDSIDAMLADLRQQTDGP